MTLHLTIQNNKVAEVLQIPIERTIPWDNKIIPDTIGVYVATKSVEPESTEPYITDIKVFMADLEKLISENQLYEEGITIIKNNEFVDTIKYYALYDVKESSKNYPTETDTIIGNGYLINGRYEGNVEILLSAGDNLTRRLLFPFQTKNNSFMDYLDIIKDGLEAAYYGEIYSDSYQNIILDNPEEDGIGVYMYNPIGRIIFVGLENAESINAIIVSARLIDVHFVKE